MGLIGHARRSRSSCLCQMQCIGGEPERAAQTSGEEGGGEGDTRAHSLLSTNISPLVPSFARSYCA